MASGGEYDNYDSIEALLEPPTIDLSLYMAHGEGAVRGGGGGAEGAAADPGDRTTHRNVRDSYLEVISEASNQGGGLPALLAELALLTEGEGTAADATDATDATDAELPTAYQALGVAARGTTERAAHPFSDPFLDPDVLGDVPVADERTSSHVPRSVSVSGSDGGIRVASMASMASSSSSGTVQGAVR